MRFWSHCGIEHRSHRWPDAERVKSYVRCIGTSRAEAVLTSKYIESGFLVKVIVWNTLWDQYYSHKLLDLSPADGGINA
jgi:hypothetical protein